jgi:hypothetical protein
MRERIYLSDDDIDRALSAEEPLLPSSGFAASVLDAVQREAALRAPLAPEPSIPFPWHIFLSGLAACLVLPGLWIALVVRATAQTGMQVEAQPHWAKLTSALLEKYVAWMTALPVDLQQAGMDAVHRAVQMGAGWVILALVLSWVSVQWSASA